MKNIFNLLAIVAFGSLVNAQVNVNNGIQPATINNSNAAIDLSSAFSTEAGAGANIGKGIIIPSVNLVNFEFDTSLADGSTFPTFFDGMIVYNNANGTTLTAGNRSSTATIVSPGYYFFYNPNGSTNGAVQQGVWRPLGADPKVNIATAETVTNTLVNGNQVYARRGTFQTSGSSTTPTSFSNAAVIPAAGSLYRITIYQSGTNNVYSNSVYSYNNATGSFVTGSPSMSVVYPAGTYNYTIEYTKTNL